MWEYKFTQEDVAEANNLAKHLARANLNSITKGEGHSAGKMGEIAVLNYNDRFKINDTFNNDLILDNSIAVEIKTKRRKFNPLMDWDASIAESSLHQKPDIYIFVSLTYSSEPSVTLENLTNVWVIGQISREDYFKKAKHNPIGTPIGKGKKSTRPMYNIKYYQLNPLSSLLEEKQGMFVF